MPLYKVVSNSNSGKLVSVYAYGQFECSYSPGIWTEAPVGGLLCFDTLSAAKRFLCEGRGDLELDLELWQCEGEEPISLGGWNLQHPALGWNNYDCDCYECWPQGTVAYKRVRLLHRIPFTLPAWYSI